MIRVRRERFLPGNLKKLHARRMSPYRVLKMFGFNAYKLDIPVILGLIWFSTSRT